MNFQEMYRQKLTTPEDIITAEALLEGSEAY